MMKKAFLLLTIIIAAYAVYDFKSEKKAAVLAEESALVLPMKSEQIQRLTISQPGKPTQEFLRDSKGWQMLQPLKDSANEGRISAFIDGLVTEKSSATVKDNGQFGFKPSKGTIFIEDNSGNKTSLEVGSVKNFVGDAYLKKNNSDQILVVSSTWFAKIDKGENEFRDLRLLRFKAAQVDKLQFSLKGKILEIISKEGQWIAPAAPQFRLDQNRVREILAMLNTTEALEMIAATPTDKEIKLWNLNRPELIITAISTDRKPWIAKFARDKQIARIQTSEPAWVVKVSPADYEKFLDVSLDNFRDRGEPFNFDKLAVKAIEVQSQGKKITPNSESETFRNISNRLANMKIENFEPPVPKNYNFTNDAVLKDQQNKTLLKFSWGEPLPAEKNKPLMVLAKSSLYEKPFTVLVGDLETLKLSEKEEKK